MDMGASIQKASQNTQNTLLRVLRTESRLSPRRRLALSMCCSSASTSGPKSSRSSVVLLPSGFDTSKVYDFGKKRCVDCRMCRNTGSTSDSLSQTPHLCPCWQQENEPSKTDIDSD